MTVRGSDPARRRLRVLHVMGRMAHGGTERQLIGMLEAAHGLHWDATLCVLRPATPLADAVKAAGVEVVELPYTAGADLRRPLALRTLLGQRRFDVVHPTLHLAGMLTRTVNATLPYARRPAVVLSERRVEDGRKLWARVIDRRLGAWTDHYIGNSDDVAEFITRSHGVERERVTVVRNGIDDAVFTPRTTPPDGAMRRIGYVGRLVAEKAVDVLLEALPEVMRSLPVELQIAGDGPERPYLETIADGLPVTFLGRLETPGAVAAFLHGVDVLALPSRYEGLPNVLLEALACGVPAVATDVAGTRDLRSHLAAVVPPDDPTALAAALTATLRRPPPAQGGAALSFDEVARRHAEVFEMVAKG